MRRLILMRHAKSDWSAGHPDHDRPLNKRGHASADAMGNWLRKTGYQPEQLLCSTAQRTRETLKGLRLPSEAEVSFHHGLYLAEATRMLTLLQRAEHRCILILGHNHGIADMAHNLVSERPAHDRFDDYPTAATLVCDFDGDSWKKTGWHEGQPVAFVVPRELT